MNMCLRETTMLKIKTINTYNKAAESSVCVYIVEK